MSSEWIKRWDDRYRDEAFAYGEAPNAFLKEKLTEIPPGKILFPAEGEGRNAVYAATLGWDTHAFDISTAGKEKAMRLAEKQGVVLHYEVGEIHKLGYESNSYDAIALIYAHFPAEIKSKMHTELAKLVRQGGIIIFEAFSKNHLEYIAKNEKVGGPKDIEMLFSKEEIRRDFAEFEALELEEKEIELLEGLYHNGIGSVIRFVGRKK